MIGPKRFKDLLEGLPGIGTNLLADRLKELERAGIVSKRVLPPPSGSTVYELTTMGKGLEPVVFALGRWGHQFLSQQIPGEISKPGWFMVALRGTFRADHALGVRAQYELRIDNEVFQAVIAEGKLRIAQGPPLDPSMTLITNLRTLIGLISGVISPNDALRSGKVSVEGNPDEVHRFVGFFAWGARLQEREQKGNRSSN
jgi:putative sterol carrier protein